MPGITCPKCFTENWPDAQFCKECRTELQEKATPAARRQVNVADGEEGIVSIGGTVLLGGPGTAPAIGLQSSELSGGDSVSISRTTINISGGTVYFQSGPQTAAPTDPVSSERAQPKPEPVPPPPAPEPPRRPDIRAIPAENHWAEIGVEPGVIRGGTFLYGPTRETASLETYRISRTAITNRQYQAFVSATGYPTPYHWQSGQPPANKLEHPVVNVSWYDTQAFCRWAGVRLPSEMEWEKAARGTDGRPYPWGSTWQTGRCNSAEAGQKGTTPVSRYPGGASPYGALDMSGNVWEWCLDWHDQTAQERVLRGGSFHFSRHAQHCAWRHKHLPDCCSPDFGFRVVMLDA